MGPYSHRAPPLSGRKRAGRKNRGQTARPGFAIGGEARSGPRSPFPSGGNRRSTGRPRATVGLVAALGPARNTLVRWLAPFDPTRVVRCPVCRPRLDGHWYARLRNRLVARIFTSHDSIQEYG